MVEIDVWFLYCSCVSVDSCFLQVYGVEVVGEEWVEY